jgi:hypothetical protein
MKHLLLLGLLLTGLVGCKKNDTATADPFLGHWQSDMQRSVTYDANGQISSDVNGLERQDLDVTPTTITFTGYQPNWTPRTPSVKGYTRVGEDLVFAGSSPVLVIYHVRSLSATSFTLESDYYSTLSPSSPRTATSYIPFHR